MIQYLFNNIDFIFVSHVIPTCRYQIRPFVFVMSIAAIFVCPQRIDRSEDMFCSYDIITNYLMNMSDKKTQQLSASIKYRN